MPSTHLPPSSSAGLVVHWAERNDNVSSSQGPSRSRQEEILMENKVWNVDTNLADPQQCFTFTSATRCQGFNYLFSPLRYMDVFREFQVMRGEDGESMFEWTWQVCIELTGMAHLSDLPLLPGTLSLFFTLNINEGKHCSDLANQLTLSDILDENGKCEPVSYFSFNITLWVTNAIFVVISWYLIPLVSTDPGWDCPHSGHTRRICHPHLTVQDCLSSTPATNKTKYLGSDCLIQNLQIKCLEKHLLEYHRWNLPEVCLKPTNNMSQTRW